MSLKQGFGLFSPMGGGIKTEPTVTCFTDPALDDDMKTGRKVKRSKGVAYDLDSVDDRCGSV